MNDGIFILDSPMKTATINMYHNEQEIIPEYIHEKYSELKSISEKHVSNDTYININLDIKNVFLRSGIPIKNLGIKSGIYPEFDLNKEYKIHTFDIYDKTSKEGFNDNKKYKTLLYTKVGNEIHEYLKQFNNNCEKEEYLYKLQVKLLYILMNHIELGGNMYLSYRVICKSYQIEYIHLLSYLFKKITIYDGIFLFCEDFMGDKFVSKSDIVKIINKKFTIEHDETIKNYLINIYQYYIKLYTYKINNDRDDYLKHTFYNHVKSIINNNIDISESLRDNIYDLILYLIKDKLYSVEGEYIKEKIIHYRSKKCLEIGFDYALTSVFILSIPNTILISIDPYQKRKWNNYGKKIIKHLNLQDRHKLIEDYPLIGLPKLLKYKFDFIYLNGNNRFDELIIYFFYAIKLMDINGIIIITNALTVSSQKFIKFVDNNYVFCRKIVSPHENVCYKITSSDNDNIIFNNF